MPECELETFLRAAGPERVPLRSCCVVALIARDEVPPAVERLPACAAVRDPEPVR
jgi:hypothetical protein